MGRFLQICFGCHARPDRSFHIHGKQFPICARCTGELAGILVAIPISWWMGTLDIPVLLILMLPMLLDGFVQLLTTYESTNFRRFVTGFLFGFALISAVIHFHRGCVRIAGWIVLQFVQDPEKVRSAMQGFW